MANGSELFQRLIRPDLIPSLNAMFEADHQARAAGKPAATIPVVHDNPLQPCSLPSSDSYEFFTPWQEKSTWKNKVTVRSLEQLRACNPSSQHVFRPGHFFC